MRRLQILRGQLQYKPELKDGEFFLDKTNHSLLIGDAAVADGQFELAKQSAITNLQQQVDTKITADQAPVQSVNTKTGAVVLTAADVGALPDTTSIPTKTSELTNDSNFVDTTTLNSSLANKQNTITGGASTITDDNLTTNRALISNSSGKVAVSAVTATELSYLDGVTSNIQTQIDANKIPENDVILKQETKTITLPNSADWKSVTYGNGKFVAVADTSGKAAYSTDGITWTASTMSGYRRWYSVTYGNGKFVAVVYNNSNVAAYSTDGITWTTSTLPSSADWYSVTYGDGKFVAVSSGSSKAAYSTDGVTWTASTLPIAAFWDSVTYGNGKFVAVSEGSSTNNAAYSTDGITWTSSTLPSSTTYWQSATYGDGKFVAVARNSNAAAYSTDGITWTSSTLPSSADWRVTYGSNGKFVAVSSGSSKAAYSTDGVTWTASTMPENNYWGSATYGNGKFVAIVGYNSNKAAISTDGITWISTVSTNTLVNPSNTDITESVYNTLSPYIPTPTVPTKTSELTNDSGFITQTDGVVQDGLVGMSLTGSFGIGTLQTPATDDVALFVNGNVLIKNSDRGVTYIETKDDLLTLDNLKAPTSNSMATPKSYVDQYAPHATLVTLTVAGWNSTSKTQTVTVSGILADESEQLIIPMPATASMTAYNEAGIQCTGQAANSLTFTAETVPTAAISVYVTYQAVIS